MRPGSRIVVAVEEKVAVKKEEEKEADEEEEEEVVWWSGGGQNSNKEFQNTLGAIIYSFMAEFYHESKLVLTNQPMYGPTDRPTDTPSNKDAWSLLKNKTDENCV